MDFFVSVPRIQAEAQIHFIVVRLQAPLDCLERGEIWRVGDEWLGHRKSLKAAAYVKDDARADPDFSLRKVPQLDSTCQNDGMDVDDQFGVAGPSPCDTLVNERGLVPSHSS